MSNRRKLRTAAGHDAAAAGLDIPSRLLRFDLAGWPPAPDDPDVFSGTGEHAAAAARFFAKRRWYRAQREWCDATGMTVSQLRRLIWPERT